MFSRPFLSARKLMFLHICILLFPFGRSNTPHKSECQTSLSWVTSKPTTNKTPSVTPWTENSGKFITVVQQKQEVRGKKDHSFLHHAWGLNEQGMGSAFDKWPVSVLQKEAEITIGRNHATGISCCFIVVCKLQSCRSGTQ